MLLLFLGAQPIQEVEMLEQQTIAIALMDSK